MAHIKNNARVLCLVALMVMSTALFSCDAARSIDIGTKATAFGKLCFAFSECADSWQYAFDDCNKECKKQGYDWYKGYCKNENGGMCCCLPPA